ncbi:hypothetical protein MRX96_009010 [Rhipicephalus microplus]
MSRSQRSRCVVAGCESDSTVRINRVSEDPERRHAWLGRIGWPASRQRAPMFVCEQHFSAEDYTKHAGVMQATGFQTGRLHLSKDAVPSLFLSSIPAMVCQCSCHHPARASVATQCSLGMKAARDLAFPGVASTAVQGPA